MKRGKSQARAKMLHEKFWRTGVASLERCTGCSCDDTNSGPLLQVLHTLAPGPIPVTRTAGKDKKGANGEYKAKKPHGLINKFQAA
eukprot:1146438-Pelagomonas_calceolata.AAC.1